MLKRHAGQAGLIFAEMLHQLARIAMLLVILGLLGICLLGYRLSFGPLEIPYLASELATVASGQGVSVVMEKAELAWDGYRQGGGVPLDLQLGGITVRNAEGVTLVAIPAARLVVSPSAFLSGEAPLAVTGAGARFPGSAVPVSLLAAIRISRLKLSNADMLVTLGPGRLGIGPDSVPITSGSFRLVVTPRAVTLSGGHFALARKGGSVPRVGLTGSARLNGDWRGALRITADAVEAADLAAYWPPDLVPMTRAWVTGNITAGQATRADFTFSLSAPRNLASVAMTNVSGGLQATGLTLTWLPGAVPITDLDGRYTVLDRDTSVATARAARLGGLGLSDGTMRIFGMSEPHQRGALAVTLDGPLPAAIAILAAPPLNLMRAVPEELARASGGVSVKLGVAFPFLNNLPLTDVDLNAAATLRDVAFAEPVTGLPFTEGAGNLDATMRGLRAAADIRFAGEPARLAVGVTYAGPASFHVALEGQAGPAMLHRLGLDAPDGLGDELAGTAPYRLVIDGAPDGPGEAALSADLTPVALALPRLGWAKKAGAPAALAARAALENGVFQSVKDFSVQGPGLDVQGRAQGEVLRLAPVHIGRTRASGTLTLPAAGRPLALVLSGPELDVRVVSPGGGAPGSGGKTKAGVGFLWRVALKFERVELAAAPAPALGATAFSAAGEGGRIDRADGIAPGIGLTVRPLHGGRRAFSLTAKDGGGLVRALGLYDKVQGGDMDLAAEFGAGAPVAGTLTAAKFRLMDAPVFGKILQGLTVYGFGAATSGPGLAFDHASAPFSVAGGVLRLNGARAYSSSLGFTGTGTIVLDSGETDIHGTIIPAYAINSLPGKIPLIGGLFAAQKGGGLFAVNAHVTGRISDPKVEINPLSALTPGVLRDVFGFGGPGS